MVETSLKPAPNAALETITPQKTNRRAGFQHAPTAGFPHCHLFDQVWECTPFLFRQAGQLGMKRRVMTIVLSEGVIRPVSKAEKPKRARADVTLSALCDCCGMLVDGHLAPEVAQFFPEEAEHVRHPDVGFLAASSGPS
jgi:hypothetical protein